MAPRGPKKKQSPMSKGKKSMSNDSNKKSVIIEAEAHKQPRVTSSSSTCSGREVARVMKPLGIQVKVPSEPTIYIKMNNQK